MKTIDKKELLMQRIIALESKQAYELNQLKSEFHTAIDQLSPWHLIKNAFTGFTSSPDTKSNLLDSAVDIASHFIAKNTMLGVFQTPIKNVLRNVLAKVLNKVSPKKELQH